MKKNIAMLTLLLMSSALTLNAQFKDAVKNKVRSKLDNSSKVNVSGEKGQEVITLEELNAKPYCKQDRILATDNGPIIFKKVYQEDFKDAIDFSGFYYLNSYAFVQPSSHFSSDTVKAYGGFSIDYSQDKHTMQVYWSKSDANYAMVPDQYKTSADKGNVMFQMGMTGGPESYFNAKCLVLEPGVILVGANVYHKNDNEGHAWMNNITPEGFVIAAKDTTKFKEYQSNIEYTSKVVFEKFDALRAAWKNQQISDAKPLPSEGMKNAKLKSEALSLINRTAKGYKWKEEVLYAYIESTVWDIKKHPLSGLPLKRIAKAIVVMKTPKGNYKREGFYIAQNYDGTGSYGNTYMLYNDQKIYFVKPSEAMKYK